MRQDKPHFYQRLRFLGAILLVGIGAFSLIFLEQKMNTSNKDRNIVAILSGEISLPLDPSNISMIPLYQVHLNLWDTLLSSNGNGALADIKGQENSTRFRFEIHPNSKFSNGRKITSQDILFSLHRLMDLQPGGHFNAKSVIKTIDLISDSEFQITLHKPTPAFLFLISIPEMGIVPKEACDEHGKIINLGVTSGAYTVSGSPTPEKIVLKKNPYFIRHNPKSPDQVTVLFMRGVQHISQAFDLGKADFTEIYNSAGQHFFRSSRKIPI